jgi:adenylylsulfate kinase
VYLDCDVKECSKRDYKGNYDKAFSGKLENFIGVSEQYEESDEYDLVLHTGRDSIETCSSLLLEKIKQTINI